MALVITSAVITNLGENLIASAIVGSGTVTLTSVQFGSGFPALGDNIPSYTSLKNVVMNGTITGSNNIIQSQATIRVNISSSDAPITFQVNEIGVFAQLGASPPILFAYTSTGGPTGDTVTPSAPSSAIIKDYALLILFTQNVPSDTNVTLQQVVGLHAVSHILPGGIDPLPTPTPASNGLTPATNNDATQVLLGGSVAAWGAVPLASLTKKGGTLALTGSRLDSWRGDGSWQPGILVITSNITLFVSTTGNDSTAQPNNPALPWASIQGALNYLIPYFIEPGVVVTISVAAGTYTSSTPIIVNHPQGQNIQIIGTNSSTANSISASVTGGGLVTLNTSAGGWTTAGIAATGFVVSLGLATQNGIVESGVYQLLSNNGTTLTYGSGGVNPSGVTFTVFQLKTVLSFSAGVQGIIIAGNGLGQLKNFIIVGVQSGANTIQGIQVNGGATVNAQTVGTYGWRDSASVASAGFSSSINGFLNCTNCYATNNTNGFLGNGFGASISAVACQSNYNVRGYWADSCGMSLANCNGCGNTSVGAFVQGNATLALAGSLQCLFLFNLTGITITQNSSCVVSSTGSTLSANNTTDLSVSVLSSLVRAGANGFGYTTKSANIISNNTLTSDGCYVSP